MIRTELSAHMFLQSRSAPAWLGLLTTLLIAGACDTDSPTGLDSSNEMNAPDAGAVASATQGLWYSGSALCALAAEQLRASGKPSVVQPIALPDVTDVAFDGRAHAWVVVAGAKQIYRYSQQSLQAGINSPASKPEPDLIVSSDSLTRPQNLGFDHNGALWIVDTGSKDDGYLLRFEIPADLTGAQQLVPTLKLSSAHEGDFFKLGHIAFDASGALWVTSFAGVMRFDDLGSKSGEVSVEPSAMIEKDGYLTNIYFYSLAFDAAGALWAGTGDGYHYLTSISKFAAPNALVGRSSPEPVLTILGVRDALPAGGLAFDADGTLWFATYSTIVSYTDASSLIGLIDPPPALTVDLSAVAAPGVHSHLVLGHVPSAKGR